MMESIALLLAATLNAGTVLAIASLGLLINEKAGIVNLGAEGMMLCAAIAGFATVVHTGNSWLGFAAGMAAALKLGENSRSMLMTRALAEMSRFAVQLGANPLTFLGLAGVGDLIATCSSPLSRNYQVGFALGSGQTLADVIEELEQTAEGINTIQIVKQKADEFGVYMPIVSGLYEIIFNEQPLDVVLAKMMQGGQSSDVEFVLPRTGGQG